MAGFTINKKQADDAGNNFPEIPAGVYKVVCSTDSKEDVTKNGKNCIVLVLEIIEDDKGDISMQGQKIWHRIIEGEYLASFLGQAMTGFGIPISEAGTTVDATTFIGNTATVQVVRNGDYTNVKKFLPKEVAANFIQDEPETDIPF